MLGMVWTLVVTLSRMILSSAPFLITTTTDDDDSSLNESLNPENINDPIIDISDHNSNEPDNNSDILIDEQAE